MMDLYIDPELRRLSGAILEQAGKDYFDLLRGKIAPKGDCNIQECEAFFRSPWFSALCTDESDGERIIEIIRKITNIILKYFSFNFSIICIKHF